MSQRNANKHQEIRSMPLFLPIALLVSATLLIPTAHGQVVRCTDTRTGAVSYTDGNCAAGSKALEVQAPRTPAQLAQERAQAAEALARKEQRLQAEAAAAQRDAEQTAQRQQEQAERAAAMRARPQDYARSPECARARRNLDMAASRTPSHAYGQEAPLQVAQRQMELDCLGPEAYADLEKNRPAAAPATTVVLPPPRPHWTRPTPPAPPPPRFTHCNVFRCYDQQGRSHTRP